jgi:succinyl-diaminopimelate desuccinylase
MAFDFLSAARDLIAIDSRSTVSNDAVVRFLTPLCRAADLDVQVRRETRDGVDQFNLVATRDGGGEGALLLTTHLDTVPPGDPSLWTVSGGRPFALTERDGELYGLGSADVKLDFLCKLAALERLRTETLRRPVLLAGTYGEEVGRYGAALFVRTIGTPPAMALVGEPTGLQACLSHKGYVEVHVQARATAPARPVTGPVWRLRFTGVAAHSSQPDRGVSACDLLLDALPALRRSPAAAVIEARGGDVINLVAPSADLTVAATAMPAVTAAEATPLAARESRWSPPLANALARVHACTVALRDTLATWRDDAFRPAYSTVNNGLLRLGADRLGYACDLRLLPGDAPRAALDAYLDQLRGLRIEGAELTVSTRFDAPAFAARSDSTLVPALKQTLAEHSLPLSDEAKSGTTEATVYAQAGIDTVVFGPGVATGNIHKPDEHVPVAHLRHATDVYEGVVRRLCL